MLCPICNNPSKPNKESCGTRKCSASLARKRLREDPIRYAAFVAKTSGNAKQQHSERTEDEASVIRKKISTTRREANAKLSVAELKAKYGKNPAGYSKSLKDFWQSASDERKEEVYEKRFRARTENIEDDPYQTELLLQRIDAFLASNPDWAPEPFRGLI